MRSCGEYCANSFCSDPARPTACGGGCCWLVGWRGRTGAECTLAGMSVRRSRRIGVVIDVIGPSLIIVRLLPVRRQPPAHRLALDRLALNNLGHKLNLSPH